MRMQTVFVGLAVTALAAGCAFGGNGTTHHPTLAIDQALHQARTDGFSGPVRVVPSGSMRCDERTLEFGPTQTTGHYAAYRRPSYGIEFSDRRAVPKADVARIGMEVFVFPSARFAARCAQAGIYSSTADGPVFAFGQADNSHDSQIVQADLARIADEIAG